MTSCRIIPIIQIIQKLQKIQILWQIIQMVAIYPISCQHPAYLLNDYSSTRRRNFSAKIRYQNFVRK